MKIYWYAPFDNASEIELARALCRSGDALTLQAVSSRFGRPLPTDELSFELIRDLPPPASETYQRATAFRRAQVALTRALKRHRRVRARQFEVVHLHTYNMFTDWLALRLLRRSCSTLVLSVHNVVPHERRGPRAVEHLLHKWGYDAADHVVVAHEHLRNRLVSEFELDANAISVIPLPSPSTTRTRQRPAMSPKEILFFGTLRRNKGIEALLRAIEVIPPDIPVRFVFAGRGDQDLEQLVAAAAESDARILAEIGWIPPERQAELYSRAWAVVVPYSSAFAAQSGTVRVAYSFGTPVIASDVGALGDLVRADESGWLIDVDADDVGQLADLICHALSDEAGQRRYAGRARALGLERSPVNLAMRFRDLYGELCEA